MRAVSLRQNENVSESVVMTKKSKYPCLPVFGLLIRFFQNLSFQINGPVFKLLFTVCSKLKYYLKGWFDILGICFPLLAKQLVSLASIKSQSS